MPHRPVAQCLSSDGLRHGLTGKVVGRRHQPYVVARPGLPDRTVRIHAKARRLIRGLGTKPRPARVEMAIEPFALLRQASPPGLRFDRRPTRLAGKWRELSTHERFRTRALRLPIKEAERITGGNRRCAGRFVRSHPEAGQVVRRLDAKPRPFQVGPGRFIGAPRERPPRLRFPAWKSR